MTERTWTILLSVAPLTLGLFAPFIALWVHRSRNEVKEAKAEGGKLRRQLKASQRFEIVGAMTAGLVHDLNNVFTAVQGALELADLESIPLDRRMSQLRLARTAAIKGSDMLQQVLRFTRGHGGHRERVNLCIAIQELEGILGLLVPRRIPLTFETPNHPLWALVDKGSLFQVVLNLVVNAKDAIGEGSGWILVSLARVDGELHLAVADTGCGIPPENLGKICQPLFTTKPEGKGTGLGLSVVRDELNHMGGRLEVQSAVGKGTTFTVILPEIV